MSNTSVNIFLCGTLLLLALTTTCCWEKEKTAERFADRMIAAAKDGEITAKECRSLYAYYSAIKDNTPPKKEAWIKMLQTTTTEEGTTPTVDCAKTTFPAPAVAPLNPACPQRENRVNVYVENSASMHPYLKTGFEMKLALLEMKRRIEEAGSKGRFYLKNDLTLDIHQLKGENAGKNSTLARQNQLKEWLDPAKMRGRDMGDYLNSRLITLLDDLVQETVGDCEPRMVFSDFIYSLDGNQEMAQEMKEVTSGIGTVFSDAGKNGIALLMVKFSGNYDGYYYSAVKPISGGKKFNVSGMRPFYAWVVGNTDDINGFADKYSIADLPGYVTHTTIGPKQTTSPLYSLLTRNGKGKTGICSDWPDKTKKSAITSLYSCEDDEKVAYDMALDLSRVLHPGNYLANASNYRIEGGKAEDNWAVTQVTANGTITERDLGRVSAPTHVISLRADGLTGSEHSLSLVLRDTRPAWLDASHTESDRREEMDKLRDKTFGYRYLVDGVWNAYRPDGEAQNTFTLPFTFSKKDLD